MKHVEKRNKHTKKLCAPSWLYLDDYTEMHGQQNIIYTRLSPRRLNLPVKLCGISFALMCFLVLTADNFLGQSVLASQVKKDTIQRRRSRLLSLYGFLDQKYNTVYYLNDLWYLPRCERMRHKQVSRCAQSTPRASQQPRHYTQKGGVHQPWEPSHKTTNRNTDTPGKMSAVWGKRGTYAFCDETVAARCEGFEPFVCGDVQNVLPYEYVAVGHALPSFGVNW
jgi:hypothetical protein